MSEAPKVRLVRCPKCDNFLPELDDYSVYKCGGCGALLRAKDKSGEVDGFLEQSDEKRVPAVGEKFSENFEFSAEKKMVNSRYGSGLDAESNGSRSSSRDGKGKISCDSINSCRNGSINKGSKCVAIDDLDMNKSADATSSNMAEELYELRRPTEITNRLTRSRQSSDWGMGERGGMEGLTSTECTRYSSFKNEEESSSHFASVLSKVEHLEQDRAELLRKLDELKGQLRDVDTSKEKIPPHRSMVHTDAYGDIDGWIPRDSLRLNRPPLQFALPARHVSTPPYGNHYAEPSSFTDSRDMGYVFHPSVHHANQFQGLGNPYRSQMRGRAPPQSSGPFRQLPHDHPNFSRQYLDNNPAYMGPFEPYQWDANRHHPSCSCSYCRDVHYQAPPLVPAPVFRDSRFSDVPNNPVFFNPDDHVAFSMRAYNPEAANPLPFSSCNPQSHVRWTKDCNSDGRSFVHRCPPRVIINATSGHRCCPIAGGAPFLTCFNCFELLQLPVNFFQMEKDQKKMEKDQKKMEKDQKKMKCGSCFMVMTLKIFDKRLVVSIHKEVKRTSADVKHNLNVIEEKCNPHAYRYVNKVSGNFSSDDYDESGYDFQPMDRDETSSSIDHGIGSNKSGEMSSRSMLSCTSEDENNPSAIISASKRNLVGSSSMANASPPPAGSPLQDHFDYSNKYHRVVNRIGSESRSGRSERETVMPERRVTTRQDSVKDAYLATEIDISSKEYANTGTSDESGDASREEHPLRGNKGAESFFAGIKKSFKDFSRASETFEPEKTSVNVNGHPIPERLVKKAEKFAGTIQPGDYWYDFRAGFWGVTGGPCLGIIPPFIEEFNYPIQKDCAGGNTGVLVNGRELHSKDLALLISRGLPNEEQRSYIIEISGRVLDEDSGEELESLGKLAPTVEKLKRGFGMKAPKVAW